jgi:hypothetical protein
MTTKANLGNAGSVETMQKSNSVMVEVDGAVRRITLDKFVEATDLSQLLPYTEDSCSYGVTWDTTVSSSALTRVGSSDLHKTLPIQSRMRGCLLNDDGEVVDYLGANDWTGYTRDGSRGQVMVEIPMHYRKCSTEGTKETVRISELPLPGYTKIPKMYIGAYQAVVDRTNLKLCSVVNTTTQYRGGNNTADWDGTYRSQLGVPASGLSLDTSRTYARKRKTGDTQWNAYAHDAYMALYWLYVVEYANFNSQLAYNATPTSEGYKQGGLGDGVTTWSDSEWSSFNGRYAFVNCGVTDGLGNGTGTVAFAQTGSDGSTLKTFNVPRYRGIENPFGHVWQWVDGILFRVSADTANGGDGLSKAYVCSDPAKFSSSSYANYTHVGNIDRNGGYIKSILFGETGEVLPKSNGGSATTYFCDNHYTNIPSSGEVIRGAIFGGDASYGSSAGLACVHSDSAPSPSRSNFGSRLCFIPTTEA